MNLLKNTLVSKLLLVAFILLGAKAVSAQEARLYIDQDKDVVIKDYEPKEISIVLKHDGTMGAVEFNVCLSPFLEFTKDEEDPHEPYPIVIDPAFANDGHVPTCNVIDEKDANGKPVQRMKVVVASMNSLPFRTTEGVVAKIKVNAREGMLDKTLYQNPDLSISLKNIELTTPDGSKSVAVGEESFDLSKVSEIKMAMTEGDNIVVNPGSTKKLTLNLVNSSDVASFSFKVAFPEGFSTKEFVKDPIRVRNSASVKYVVANKKVTVSDIKTNNAIKGNSGDILSFDLQVPAEFGETATIKFYEITVGSKVGGEYKSLYGPDFEIKVVNGAPVKAKADAEIAKLQKSLADSVAKIVATCPDVKDNFKGEEIAKTIAALQEKVNAAYNDCTLASKYDEIMAPKAEIEASIAKLVDDAEAAQKAFALDAANKKAKEDADAAVKALNDALKAATDDIAEKYPLVADKFKGEDIAAAIAEIEKNVAAALEAKELAAKYDATVKTPAEEVNKLIAALSETAKAESDRVAKNDAAYKADIAALEALEKELADTIATFDKEWTNLHLDYQNTIKREIKELKKEIEAEKARVAEEGEYAYELDPSMVKAMIAEYKNKVVTSGIDSIVADEELGNARIYTIDGVQHSRLVPGVNIIVKADGTTTKVYVK